MHLSPMVDLSDSMFFIFDGIQSTIAVFLFTVLVEGVAMRYLGWDSLRRCMVDSFVMNAVSLGAGMLLVVLYFFVPLIQDIAESMLVGIRNVMLSFLIGWIASVLIEGATLLALRRGAPRSTLRMMLIVNALSYVGLIIAYVVFLA
jgi:hypothetical protein